MVVVSALATHHWARVQALESLSRVPADTLLARVAALPAVREAAVLPTCNRVEVYVATESPADARAQVGALLRELAPDAVLESLVRWSEGPDAAHHLLRVAAGLDSMVVGEPQILGQVKEAHERARRASTLGPELGLLLPQAIQAGKRVRTETKLAQGAVTVGSAAVVLAKRSLGTLDGKRVVLVGTGEMAGLVARALKGEGCRVAVVSRRTDRARTLAAKLEGAIANHAELPALVREADVVVYATSSPKFLLDAATLRGWLGGPLRDRSLLVLDVANPRNVGPDVARLRGVALRNLDSLRALGKSQLAGRKREAVRAEAIVREELQELVARDAERMAEQVVRALYERMHELGRAEAAKALRMLDGMGADARTQEVVQALAESMVRKMLAAPTAGLKDLARRRDEEALRRAAQLLGVEEHVPRRATP